MFVQDKFRFQLARLAVPIVFLGIAANVAFATTPRKFDEFSKLSCSDELIRLDNYGKQLRAEPNFLGVIIVYGARSGTRRGEVIARLFAIRDALVRRNKLNTSHLAILDGGFRNNFVVELWTLPLEARESMKYLITTDVSPESSTSRTGAFHVALQM